jgi:hypothetical protein
LLLLADADDRRFIRSAESANGKGAVDACLDSVTAALRLRSLYQNLSFLMRRR